MYSPDKVKKVMWDDLARKGVITGKKETNIKKYLDALCERLYLNSQ